MALTRVAVLLAAGVGARLRPLTDDRPKALVEVGGESLLLRAVHALAAHGVEELIVATGYREDAVRAALAAQPLDVTCCPNPRYADTQNSVSLALCRAAVRGRGFFRLDADLLFDERVLGRLEASAAGLAVAVDSQRPLDAEAMKVRVGADGRITHFGKALPFELSAGESIGIERLDAATGVALFEALERAVAAGHTDLYYEDVYARALAEEWKDTAIWAAPVEVGDLAWAEVDDLDDLARAEALCREGGPLASALR